MKTRIAPRSGSVAGCDEAVVHRGHPHEHRARVFGQCAECLLGVEARHPGDGHTQPRTPVERKRETVHVMRGQGVQDAVVGLESPGGCEAGEVRLEILERERNPFGLACGAAGEDEQSGAVGRELRERDCGSAIGLIRIAEQRRELRALEHPLPLGLGERGVDRNHAGPGGQHGEVRRQQAGPASEVQRHAVAGTHAAGAKGIEEKKTFLGLGLETQRDMVLLLVEEHRARHILETIAAAGEFDATPGTGIAFQLDAEDAVGVAHQVRSITPSLDEEEL